MKYLAFGVMLIAVSCSGPEILKPAQVLAVENQQNLDSNVTEVLKHLVAIAKSHPDYSPEEDEPTLIDMATTLTEQVALSTAYIALVGAYIESGSVSIEDFKEFIGKLPELVEAGANIWEEASKAFKKE